VTLWYSNLFCPKTLYKPALKFNHKLHEIQWKTSQFLRKFHSWAWISRPVPFHTAAIQKRKPEFLQRSLSMVLPLKQIRITRCLMTLMARSSKSLSTLAPKVLCYIEGLFITSSTSIRSLLTCLRSFGKAEVRRDKKIV